VLISSVMAESTNRGLRGLCVPILVGSMSFVASCGGAQLVLKGPITDECTSAGLKGCNDISEGALLYAEGKPLPGETKLARGLRANAGKVAQLKKFADGLQLVGQIPGAGQYVAPMQPAIRLIQQVAEEEAKRTDLAKAEKYVPGPEAADDAPPAPVATVTPAKKSSAITSAVAKAREVPRVPLIPPYTSYFMVAGNGLVEKCRFVGTPKMLCLNENIDATKIISDVIVSSGCNSDVVVIGRVAIEPDWVVYVPAGRGADVHGASLPLRPGRTLTVGVAYKSEDPAPDMRCGVTVVWKPFDDGAESFRTPDQGDLRNKMLVEALRKKVQVGTASETDRRLLRALCHQLGDISCSSQVGAGPVKEQPAPSPWPTEP
jgi:hypothetical protein